MKWRNKNNFFFFILAGKTVFVTDKLFVKNKKKGNKLVPHAVFVMVLFRLDCPLDGRKFLLSFLEINVWHYFRNKFEAVKQRTGPSECDVIRCQ